MVRKYLENSKESDDYYDEPDEDEISVHISGSTMYVHVPDCEGCTATTVEVHDGKTDEMVATEILVVPSPTGYWSHVSGVEAGTLYTVNVCNDRCQTFTCPTETQPTPGSPTGIAYCSATKAPKGLSEGQMLLFKMLFKSMHKM